MALATNAGAINCSIALIDTKYLLSKGTDIK